MDFKGFKKVKSDKDSTTLKHPQGHEIRVLHKPLSKAMKVKLDALPMAEGGEVKKPTPTPDEQATKTALQQDAAASRQSTSVPAGNGMGDVKLRERYQYAEGGQVKDTDLPEPQNELQDMETPSPTPTPQPTPRTKELETRSKAGSGYHFHFYADGGEIDQSKLMDIPKVAPTPLQQEIDAAYAQQHPSTAESMQNISSAIPSAAVSDPAPDTAPQATPEAPIAPPSQSQPSHGMDLIGQALGAVGQANQAELGAAKNIQGSEAVKADLYGQQAKQMQDMRAKYEQYGNDLHAKFDDLSQQVSQGKIDPHNWWDSKSTGSKIMTGIGMLLVGAASGAGGHPEMINNVINQAIDRDIDAQKANLQNKNTLLGKYMEMYNSLPQAEAAARLTMSAGLEGLINQQAAKTNSQNAVLAAQKANADRRLALLPQMEGLAKAQMMIGMYGSMGRGQPSSSQEQAYQQHMQQMRMMNPELGKDMEAKYLPGVGIAAKEVPQDMIQKLAAGKDLSNKLQNLENFAKQHQGTVLDRATVTQGQVLAADAQQAARVAGHQGVYKESDQKFLESMIDSDPTKFMASVRTIPKYRTLRQQNESTMNTMYKSYGVKPFQDSAPQQQGSQVEAAKAWLKANPKDPRAKAVRQKLGL